MGPEEHQAIQVKNFNVERLEGTKVTTMEVAKC